MSYDADTAKKSSIDWWLFAVVAVLLGFGIMMVLSASGVVGERLFSDRYFFFKRQILFLCSGIALVGIVSIIPFSLIHRLQYVILFACIAVLALTLTPLADGAKGAHRWLSFGPFKLQPMEFTKIALILYLAYFMSAKQAIIRTFSRGVIPPFVVTAILCGILLAQPDFGGAAILLLLLFFMCFAGGTRFIYLFCSAGLALGAGALLVLHYPYRLRRFTAFLDPFKEAQDSGYQIVQSLYALGLGGLNGVGIGAGKQKLLYLPEAHNDFIVAVVGEELGFVGISLIFLLFAFMFWRCFKIILQQEDLRDKLTAYGLTLIILLGTVLNMSVVLAVAPPKGVPMPFLSYGGSNLLSMLLCVGLLLNLSRNNAPVRAG